MCQFALLLGVIMLLLSTCAAAAAPPRIAVPWEQARQLVRPRPLQPRTGLAHGGRPAALIACPDLPEYRQVGEQLQQALERQTGVKLPLVAAGSLVEGVGRAFKPEILKGKQNLILLGDLNSNPAIARLYIQWQAFEDAAYPGAGGHTIRTLCDPAGNGWNAVILGGPGPAEVAVAAREYAALVQVEGGEACTPYSLRVQWGEGPQAAEMKRRYEAVLQSLPGLELYLLDPASAAFKQKKPQLAPQEYAFDLLTYAFACPALHYATSGDERMGRAALRVLDALYRHMDWVEANRTASWDSHYSIEIWLRGWQQLAQTGLPTTTEREHGYQLMSFLAGQMAMYRWNLPAYGQTTYRSLTRHEWAGIFGGDALCRFVARQCDLQGDLSDTVQANRASFDVVIRTMLQSYTDGFDHKWGLDSNWTMLQAALEEPRPDFFDNGMARLCGDHAVMCLDNSGRFADFGAENVNPVEGYDAWQALTRAELIARDGRYATWVRRMPRWPYKIFILHLNWLGHWYQPAPGPAADPSEDYAGINRLPLNRHLHEDLLAGRGRVYEGIPVVNQVPYEQTFSKLTLRDGTDVGSQYLLLDGIGGITYSGNDAGAIVDYTRYGQPLLVQMEGKPDPFYQNTVSVARGNALDPTGTFARLDELVELPQGLTFVSLGLSPLTGAAQRRSLFMQSGGPCVVFDDVTLQEDDEYAVTCTFRGLGEPALDAGTGLWTLRNPLADLRLHNVTLPGLPRPAYTLSERTSGVKVEQQQFKIRVLRETVSGRFARGQSYRFANVFEGVKPGTAGGVRAVRGLTDEAVWVQGAEPAVYVVPRGESFRLGTIEAAATAARVSEQRLDLIGLRRLSLQGRPLLERETPLTLSLDFGNALGHLAGPTAPEALSVTVRPQWQRQVAFGELAGGVSLPDGTALKLDPEVVAAACRALVADAPPASATPAIAAAPAEPAAPRLQRTLLGQVGALNEVILADVTGDGQPEAMAACEDGHLRVVDLAGKLLLDLPASKSPLLTCWSGTLDGKPTILCGARDGGLHAFDRNGKPLWTTRNTHLWYGPVPSCYSLAVADFSGSGQAQIAVGTHGGVSLFDAAGSFLRFTMVYAHQVAPMQVLQVPGSAQARLLVNTWGGGPKVVEPASERAVNAWFTVWGGVASGLFAGTVAGETYVVYGGVNGTACGRLNHAAWAAGQLAPATLWQDAWYLASDGETTAVLLEDADGDGQPEVISGNETGFVVGYDLSGKRRWKRLVGTAVRQLVRVGGRLIVAGDGGRLVILGPDLQAEQTLQMSGSARRLWPVAGKLLALTADSLELLEL